MSTSNKFLIGLALALLFAIGSFGFYVGNNMIKHEGRQPEESTSKDSIIITNEVQLDTTINVSFTHIVSDFSSLQIILDTMSVVNAQSYVADKGLADFVDIYVQQDTLYVNRQTSEKDRTFVNRTGLSDDQFYNRWGAPENPYLTVTVHTPSFASLEMLRNGSVQLNEAAHFPVGKSLDNFLLKQHDGSYTNLNADFKTLTVQNVGDMWARLQVRGNAEKLYLKRIMGNVDALECSVDSVWVNAQNSQNGFNVQVQSNDYLYADLTGAGTGDVIYQGTPTVEKRESNFGRVINGNLPARTFN